MENNFSLLSLFTGGDFMITLISVLLVFASVYSWMIIIEKIRLWHFESKNNIKLNSTDISDNIIENKIAPFDKNLWFLSMVSYVSPFVGLFGTIWGVMNSFASIGANQSVSIGVIAPGLAQALGTTALGLIAAIPAAIAYQYFSKRSDDLYNRLDDSKKEIELKK